MAPRKASSFNCVTLMSRLFFPAILLLWILLFAFARNPQAAKLRGGVTDSGASAGTDVSSTDADGAEAGSSSKQRAITPAKDSKDTKKGAVLKALTSSSGSGSGSGSGSDAKRQFPQVVNAKTLSHAVIVAGHAVMRISKLAVADKDEGAWYLLKYQLNQGFPGIISSHIKKGVEIAAADPGAMLLFSGGQTRRDVGPTSEAASYYYLAQQKQWLTSPAQGAKGAGSSSSSSSSSSSTPLGGGTLLQRTYLEEHARDSYENLLFSICRFREVTGAYPQRVTVVGFDFKQGRFSAMHRAAIGFPPANFSYVGLRPAHRGFDHAKAAKGEAQVLQTFKTDPYACSSSLSEKKDVRNPFRRTVPYPQACPELQALLQWCGPAAIAADKLPW